MLPSRERPMRAVCFHGRREIGGNGIFLSAARVFGEAAIQAGLSSQVRTPGFPSPPGAPDRAVVKISKAQPADLAIPTAYDLEIVCDPRLAVVPPMGDALKKPDGLLVLDAPNATESPDIRLACVELQGIAAKRSAAPEAAHLGAALAAWEALEPPIPVSIVARAYRSIRGEPMRAAEEQALVEAMTKTKKELNIK